MAYEFTHALLPKTVTFLPNPYIPSLPILKIESPWFPIVDEIFEGSYSEKGAELWYKVSERRRKETQPDKKRFYDDLSTGLKRTEDAYEMISVFSQHHLYGKDFMSVMYGEFFNQAQLDRLYRFTREDIYQGVEYAYFPLN